MELSNIHQVSLLWYLPCPQLLLLWRYCCVIASHHCWQVDGGSCVPSRAFRELPWQHMHMLPSLHCHANTHNACQQHNGVGLEWGGWWEEGEWLLLCSL